MLAVVKLVLCYLTESSVDGFYAFSFFGVFFFILVDFGFSISYILFIYSLYPMSISYLMSGRYFLISALVRKQNRIIYGFDW